MEAMFKVVGQSLTGTEDMVVSNSWPVLVENLGFYSGFLNYYNSPVYVVPDTPLGPLPVSIFGTLYSLQTVSDANGGGCVTAGLMEEDDLDFNPGLFGYSEAAAAFLYNPNLLPARLEPFDGPIRVFQHFWKPDSSPFENLGKKIDIDSGFLPMSAMQKAQLLWTNALYSFWDAYPRGHVDQQRVVSWPDGASAGRHGFSRPYSSGPASAIGSRLQ